LKVLITIPDLKYPGGVTNYYKTIGLSKHEGIDYYYVNKYGVKLKPIYLLYRYIVFFIIVNKYDLVHLNPSFGKTATWRELFFLLISKFRRKKVIVYFRGWDLKLEGRILRTPILKKLFSFYNKADSFIVLGQIFKQKLINLGIDRNKQFNIESTVADDKYLKSFSVEKKNQIQSNTNKITFLFISRIVIQKGIILAIDIFEKVQRKYLDKNFELIIAGDGPFLVQAKEYANKSSIKNIVFVGNVINEKKYNLFKKAHIMLFPTMYGEGLPNSLLEGMLYGLPIISRTIAAIPEWIVENENGFLSDSIKSDDFVIMISKLIDNKELYHKIKLSNHKKALNLFTPNKVESRLINIYKSKIAY